MSISSAVASKSYVIAKGDTLAKISTKFYQNAKVENEKKIVAANPGQLKDVTTMLVVGKTLVIPDVPADVKKVGVILSGGNIDTSVLASLIAEN